jgi:type I restriction enzyme S subunit
MNSAWPVRKLSDLAEIRVSNVDKKTHPGEKLVKLCNYMDVYSNEYVTTELDFMEASATTAEIERFGLNCGDVVITKDSETPDDIGIAAVIAEPIDRLVCGYHLALIRPNADQIDSVYLAKQLSTSPVARYFALRASGSTRYGLSISTIESVIIPTPPKPEQAKIAEILSTVDRAIEQTEALIAKQQRIKTGLMQHLLTRGIDEHGNLRCEKTHVFKDSRLGRIPTKWEVVSLQSLANKHKHAFVDGPFGSNLKTIHYRDSGVPIIQSGFVTEGVFAADSYLYVDESKFKAEIRSKAVPGDIIMAKIGARCGRCAILPDDHPVSIIAGNCIKISISADNSNEYVLACLQHEYARTHFEDFISKTAQPAMNMPALKTMPVKRPPLDEQFRIAICLNSSRKELEEHQRIMMKLLSLKTALMQDLLTGKKRVTALLESEPKREKFYGRR